MIIMNKLLNLRTPAFQWSKVFLSIFIIFFTASCNNKFILFTTSSQVPGADKESDSSFTLFEKPLAADDKITLSVWDHDDISIGSIHSIYSLIEENGKWIAIDEQGEVKLPLVGRVKLAGLTTREATLYLEKIYSKYIQNPIINLRVLNNQVTILGEVKKPGNYIFSSDNIRLVNLVANADGFTDYARTTEIKIIRGTVKPEEKLLDYTNTYSLMGPDAMLRPGDVVYVPPTKGKTSDRVMSKLIPIASIITALVLVFTLVNK
jgi:polysaccharide export outer membrane protein